VVVQAADSEADPWQSMPMCHETHETLPNWVHNLHNLAGIVHSVHSWMVTRYQIVPRFISKGSGELPEFPLA